MIRATSTGWTFQNVARSMALALTYLLVGAACGGASAGGSAGSQPTPAAHATVSPEVQALAFSLAQPTVGDASAVPVRSKLESALLGAGYKLAVSTAAHDLDIVLTTQTQFEPSAFQVSFNGQPSGKNHVQVQVSLLSHGTLVDRTSADYTAAQGVVDEAAIASIVDAIGSSSHLTQFAQGLAQKQAAQAQAATDKQKRVEDAKQQAEQRQAHRDEDGAWYRIRLEECRVPSSAQSCDLVRAFLAKYPDGTHAADAKAALDAATPKLEALQKDEAAWAATEPDACRRGDKDGCAKVEVYLAKFPAGLHAAEGKALTAGAP